MGKTTAAGGRATRGRGAPSVVWAIGGRAEVGAARTMKWSFATGAAYGPVWGRATARVAVTAFVLISVVSQQLLALRIVAQVAVMDIVPGMLTVKTAPVVLGIAEFVPGILEELFGKNKMFVLLDQPKYRVQWCGQPKFPDQVVRIVPAIRLELLVLVALIQLITCVSALFP